MITEKYGGNKTHSRKRMGFRLRSWRKGYCFVRRFWRLVLQVGIYKGGDVDLTDRNNEKYTKLVPMLGLKYQVSFYYHKTTREFMYWGIYPWSQSAEDHVIKHMQGDLIAMAEHDIEVRKGRGGNGQAGFGDVSADKVYPNKHRRG